MLFTGWEVLSGKIFAHLKNSPSQEAKKKRKFTKKFHKEAISQGFFVRLRVLCEGKHFSLQTAPKTVICFFIIKSERLLILPQQTTGVRCKTK